MDISNNKLSKLITPRFHGVKVPFQLHDSGVKVGEPNECGAHTHRHYELKCVLSGKCIHTVDGVTYLTGKGDVLLIKPNQVHQLKICEGEELIMQNLAFYIKVNDKAEDEKRLVAEQMTELLSTVDYIPAQDSKIMSIYDLVNEEICAKRVGYYEYLESLLNMLLIELFRKCKDGDKLFPVKSDPAPLWKGRIVDFLTKRYMEDIDVQDLADHLHMSKRQVSRTFEKEFNSSFTKELMEIRLKEAKAQLRNTDKNLQDICIDIGFSNQSYFAACFKKYEGMTPSEYRAKARFNK